MTFTVHAPGGYKYRGLFVKHEPNDFVRIRVCEELEKKGKKSIWKPIKEKNQYDYLCPYKNIEEYEE